MPRDRDDERPDRHREQGEPSRQPPFGRGRGEQQPPDGKERRSGDRPGNEPQSGGRHGGRQKAGTGRGQPTRQQPSQQQPTRQQSQQQPTRQQSQQQPTRQQSQQQPSQQRQQPTRQQPSQQHQQPSQQQPSRQQQSPQGGHQTPPRQPGQTPSQQGGQQPRQGGSQSRQGGRRTGRTAGQPKQGGQQRNGPQQGGQQRGGYQEQARVSGDWNRENAPGQVQPTAGAGAQQHRSQLGRGTPGLDQSAGERPIRPRTVDDIMTEDVVAVTGDAPLHEVAATMASEEVGSVVVVDDEESPTGIITDRTIALSVDDEGSFAERDVSDVMAGDVVTVTSGTNVFEVTQRLADAGVRRLPVIDGDGVLQGIVAIDDVVVLLSRELENVADVLSTQSGRL